jgi:hypothetical protein
VSREIGSRVICRGNAERLCRKLWAKVTGRCSRRHSSLPLVIHVMDCGAPLDETGTMNERRIARAVVALAFLAALASPVFTEKN